MHKQWDEEIFQVPVKIRIQAYLLRLRSQPRRIHSPSHTEGSYVIIKKVMVLCLYYCVYELLGNYFTRIRFKWKFSVERAGGILYARRQKRQKPSSPKSVTTSYRPPDCASLTALPAKPQWQWHYSVSQQLSSKDIRPFLLQDKLEVEQVFVWAIVQNVG